MSDELNLNTTPELTFEPSAARAVEAPALTLEPSAPAAPQVDEAAQAARDANAVKLDESMLSEAEKKMVDDFSQKIDVTDSNLVLNYGAAAQKNIAAFSESALNNVKTKDLGEVGEALSSLVVELKTFGQPEKKGIGGFFQKKKNELEALKAQAVAARTYALHKICGGGSSNHPEADACDDISCCQAFRTREEAAQLWGENAQAYEEKIRLAVTETDGECILYEGQPVLAVFHSSSSGATQDASAVWSSSVPYLQSVQTPESGETVPNYHTTAQFSAAELKNRLQDALPEAKLDGRASNWFTNIRQQPNGTVTSLSVGGVAVSGTQLRGILDLRSACFTISFDGDAVLFSVTGYGHGVGMSQYGANVLAAGGMSYRDILAWYYTGTAVGTYQRT